jgi:hypothetical protein
MPPIGKPLPLEFRVDPTLSDSSAAVADATTLPFSGRACPALALGGGAHIVGSVGLTAVGDSPEEARAIFEQAQAVFDEEACFDQL